MLPLTLVEPSRDALDGFAAALRRGWSPNNVQDVSQSYLARIEADADGFLAGLTAQHGTVTLPDGTTRPRIPNRLRWMWDGEFCGSIGLRWQPGGGALPRHVLGHIGYAVVPWKRRRGYATRALGLALGEARRVGLASVDVTADPDNHPSIRVIEANGGRFVESFVAEDYGAVPHNRYRIAL